MICPFCDRQDSVLFVTAEQKFCGRIYPREYWKCTHCGYVYLHPDQRLNFAEEKLRYDRHQNDPTDKRYLRYLNHLWQPLENFLDFSDKTIRGLDFGCGPTKGLQVLVDNLSEKVQVDSYDPIYYPTQLDKEYDFLFLSEVVEHFYHPQEVFGDLLQRLLPRGLVAISTEVNEYTAEEFIHWKYRHDMTHVGFWSPGTIDYFCKRYELDILHRSGRCLVLRGAK